MDASLDRRSRRRFSQLSLRTLLVCLAVMPPLLAASWTAGSALVERYWRKEPVVWEEIGGPGCVASFPAISCYITEESDVSPGIDDPAAASRDENVSQEQEP